MTSILDIITPLNLDSERDRFLASSSYNPVFHYIWQDSKIEPLMDSLFKTKLWLAISAQDSTEITKVAGEFFEVKIDPDILDKAKYIAVSKGKVSAGSAEEVQKLFQESFDIFDLDYSVVITEKNGFNVRPSHAAKQLIVSKRVHLEYVSMEALVHHEMVHVIRYRNGKYNKITRSANYLPTEEGLASWCQDNTNDDNSYAQHAIEYVASSVGIQGSMRDVFDTMCELGMSRDLAWSRASRHKFGFVDTSKPGDILKPAMYFANEEKVAELTTNERLRLFNGKISLTELHDYTNYAGLWPDSKIIGYFKL